MHVHTILTDVPCPIPAVNSTAPAGNGERPISIRNLCMCHTPVLLDTEHENPIDRPQ